MRTCASPHLCTYKNAFIVLQKYLHLSAAKHILLTEKHCRKQFGKCHLRLASRIKQRDKAVITHCSWQTSAPFLSVPTSAAMPGCTLPQLCERAAPCQSQGLGAQGAGCHMLPAPRPCQLYQCLCHAGQGAQKTAVLPPRATCWLTHQRSPAFRWMGPDTAQPQHRGGTARAKCAWTFLFLSSFLLFFCFLTKETSSRLSVFQTHLLCQAVALCYTTPHALLKALKAERHLLPDSRYTKHGHKHCWRWGLLWPLSTTLLGSVTALTSPGHIRGTRTRKCHGNQQQKRKPLPLPHQRKHLQ